ARHHIALHRGTQIEKAPVLRLAAEAHDVLDAGTVVPATMEDDDLTRGREMRKVALNVHLRLLAVRRRRQRHHPKDAGTHSFRNRLDRPALARSVPPLKQDDDAKAVSLDPLL